MIAKVSKLIYNGGSGTFESVEYMQVPDKFTKIPEYY